MAEKGIGVRELNKLDRPTDRLEETAAAAASQNLSLQWSLSRLGLGQLGLGMRVTDAAKSNILHSI